MVINDTRRRLLRQLNSRYIYGRYVSKVICSKKCLMRGSWPGLVIRKCAEREMICADSTPLYSLYSTPLSP